MIGHVDRDLVRTSPGRALSRIGTTVAFEGRAATVKFGFIDPAVRRHLDLVARRGRAGAVDRPVFILGVGRSGTTILGRLLSAHRDVGYLNEAKALAAAVHPNDDVSNYYGRDGRFVFDQRDADNATIERAQRLYCWYARCVRANRVVHKYPEHSYRRRFLDTLLPGSRQIAIVRRPDAVASSIAAMSASMRRGNQDWWGVADHKWHLLWDQLVLAQPSVADRIGELVPGQLTEEQRGLVEWGVAMSDLLAAERGPLHLMVTLEDLRRDPAVTLERVLEAAELVPSDDVVAYANRIIDDRPARAEAVAAPAPLRQWVDELEARIYDS